jgi:hypothetical protein
MALLNLSGFWKLKFKILPRQLFSFSLLSAFLIPISAKTQAQTNTSASDFCSAVVRQSTPENYAVNTQPNALSSPDINSELMNSTLIYWGQRVMQFHLPFEVGPGAEGFSLKKVKNYKESQYTT